MRSREVRWDTLIKAYELSFIGAVVCWKRLIRNFVTFFVRDVIFTSRVYATMSVSVDVCPSVCDGSALWSRWMQRRGEGSSRAMLATARPSCYVVYYASPSLTLQHSLQNSNRKSYVANWSEPFVFWWDRGGARNRVMVPYDFGTTAQRVHGVTKLNDLWTTLCLKKRHWRCTLLSSMHVNRFW